MPKFKVLVTRSITQTADVIVEADTAEQAGFNAATEAYAEPGRFDWDTNDGTYLDTSDYYFAGETADIQPFVEPTGTCYEVETSYTEHGNCYFKLWHPNPALTIEELNDALCENGFPWDAIEKPRDVDWDIEGFKVAA